MSEPTPYGDTAFMVPGHLVAHLAQWADKRGMSMQDVLVRALSGVERQWCNECFQLWAKGQVVPK